MRTGVGSVLATAAFSLGAALQSLTAQTGPTTRASEYAAADIAFGARVYSAQCSTCHGPTGDGVGGVDLRSGKFRNASTDQDLARVINTGIQGTGMQGFRFDPPETAAIVAYVRNMN